MSPFVSSYSGRIAVLGMAVAGLLVSGGCQGDAPSPSSELADISTDVKFDSGTFGVPVSPRITNLLKVPKGGGRSQVGKPYKVRGKWYYPKDQPGYSATGVASWYGPNFHGRLTANGEVYDMHGLSAAHKTFPLPSYAMVTNTENGNSVVVRVNDRGPFAHGREIDVSSEVADLLDFKGSGTADVKVDYIGRAPIEGDDTDALMASYRQGPDSLESDVMVASAEGAPGLPGVLLDRGIGSSPQTPDPVSSYAPGPISSGASNALAALGARGRAGERIAVGLIDRDLLERVETVTLGVGKMVAEELPGLEGVSVRIDVAPGADTDALLTRLWGIGAEDAFVVRD